MPGVPIVLSPVVLTILLSMATIAAPGTSVSSHRHPDLLSKIASEYHNLAEVFERQRSTFLPPYRPFYCAIDLLQGTMPPRGR